MPAMILRVMRFLLWGAAALCVLAGVVRAEDDPKFGTAASALAFYGEHIDPDLARKYRGNLKTNFTWGVTENSMKMGWVHPAQDTWNFEYADAMLDWFEANGMHLKCHVLVWGTSSHAPAWVEALPTVEARREAVREYIRAMGLRYRDRISIYDVVNEEIHVDRWNEILEWTDNEIIVNAFTWAREVLPEATLLINDFNIIASADTRAAYVRQIKDALASGAPIDAVGLQAHFTHTIPLPWDIRTAIDEVHEGTGLPVHITEFDILPPDDPDAPFSAFENWWEYQAWAYRAAYEVFREHEAVEAIFMWGFTDALHWRPGAGILDENFDPKPVYATIRPIIEVMREDAPRAICDAGFLTIEGVPVELDGTRSIDPSGQGLTYSWTQTVGPAVQLAGADTPESTFTAPTVSGPTALGFRLDVTSPSTGSGEPDFHYVIVLDDSIYTAPVTIEAENMSTKTVGAATPDGWCIQSNGYIADYVYFPESGVYTFEVMASGNYVKDEWSVMSLRIDGVTRWTGPVESETYILIPIELGVIKSAHQIAIVFENDYYNPDTDEDRNLTVDKVEISEAQPDTAPPSVPQGLTAAHEGENSIALAWEASSDNVKVEGYRVYRDGSSTPVATTVLETYKDKGLISGTAYEYRVSAFDAAGNESAQSEPASAVTAGTAPSNNSSSGCECGFSAGMADDGAVVCWVILLGLLLFNIYAFKRR
jgi:endo-1,4-beta-xylanase